MSVRLVWETSGSDTRSPQRVFGLLTMLYLSPCRPCLLSCFIPGGGGYGSIRVGTLWFHPRVSWWIGRASRAFHHPLVVVVRVVVGFVVARGHSCSIPGGGRYGSIPRGTLWFHLRGALWFHPRGKIMVPSPGGIMVPSPGFLVDGEVFPCLSSASI